MKIQRPPSGICLGAPHGIASVGCRTDTGFLTGTVIKLICALSLLFSCFAQLSLSPFLAQEYGMKNRIWKYYKLYMYIISFIYTHPAAVLAQITCNISMLPADDSGEDITLGTHRKFLRGVGQKLPCQSEQDNFKLL